MIKISSLYLESTAYGGRKLTLSIKQTPNTANNESKIDWTLTSVGGNSNYYTIYSTSVKINGTEVYSNGEVGWTQKIFPAAKGSKSGSITVKHNNDGSKSINIYFTTAVYSTANRYTYNSSLVLDTINRAATLTYTQDFTDQVNPMIKYTNVLGSSVDSLDACISLTGAMDDIEYRNISRTGTSYTFPLTSDEISILRNATPSGQREVRFFLRTTINGSYYYSSETRNFTVTETADTKPGVSLSVSPSNGSLDSTFDGLYIQGKSKISASITASPKYSASISKYLTLIDKSYYSGDSFVSNYIESPGSIVIQSTVTDSRNFTNSDTQEITVQNYVSPCIIPASGKSSVQCFRSDVNGEPSSEGTYIYISAKRSYSPIEVDGTKKNKCSIRYRYKKGGDSSYGSWHTLLSNSTTYSDEYTGIIKSPIPPFDAVTFEHTSSYKIEIGVIDTIGDENSIFFDVPSSTVALHLGYGGKSVGIGRYADKTKDNSVLIGWETTYDNGFLGQHKNNLVGDVLAFALECGEGLTPIYTYVDSTNLPDSENYLYSTGFVHKRSSTQINVFLTNYITGAIAVNVYLNSAWSGWKYLTPQ